MHINHIILQVLQAGPLNIHTELLYSCVYAHRLVVISYEYIRRLLFVGNYEDSIPFTLLGLLCFEVTETVLQLL